MGIFQFIGPLSLPDAVFEGYSQEAVDMFNGLPSWYWVVFGSATISGLLAAITQLLRKKITVLLFLISLITVIIVQGYYIFGTNVTQILGQASIFMPILVVILSFVFYFYSKGAARKGWLR
jgi:uncharacterized membrane protein